MIANRLQTVVAYLLTVSGNSDHLAITLRDELTLLGPTEGLAVVTALFAALTRTGAIHRTSTLPDSLCRLYRQDRDSLSAAALSYRQRWIDRHDPMVVAQLALAGPPLAALTAAILRPDEADRLAYSLAQVTPLHRSAA